MGTSNAGSTDFRDAAPDAEAPQEMAVSKTLRDLSSAGKALPSPEEELQAILDSSQDGIVLVDADRRILRINKTIAETSGYSEQEIRGKPLDALISPQNLPRVFSLINMSLSGLPTQSLEVDDWRRIRWKAFSGSAGFHFEKGRPDSRCCYHHQKCG